MKSIVKAILVGGFMLVAQAAVAADSPFPSSGDDQMVQTISTDADLHTYGPVTSVGSPFPSAGDDPDVLPALGTYARRLANIK